MLLASSIVFHATHASLERGRRRRFIRCLASRSPSDLSFIWDKFSRIRTEGFTITSGIVASAFFGLTGLHGLHVALGVILMSIVHVRMLRGQYSPERDTSVTTGG